MPEVAHVGLYENDCKERNIDVDTIFVDLKHNDRAICESENDGFIKVIVKKGTDHILGATLVSENAGISLYFFVFFFLFPFFLFWLV